MAETEALSDEDVLANLRTRADALEEQLNAAHREAEARLIRAELKAEAARAGMIDLEGIRLMDVSAVKLNDRGEVADAAALMARFRRDKPWLFASASSSSRSSAPPAQPPRQKTALEMTDAEYRAARADLVKRRY